MSPRLLASWLGQALSLRNCVIAILRINFGDHWLLKHIFANDTLRRFPHSLELVKDDKGKSRLKFSVTPINPQESVGVDGRCEGEAMHWCCLSKLHTAHCSGSNGLQFCCAHITFPACGGSPCNSSDLYHVESKVKGSRRCWVLPFFDFPSNDRPWIVSKGPF